jgi:hypothetical protein
MKKIARLIQTIHAATQPYDVPADHAFSRESMDKQKAAGAAALKKAELDQLATRPSSDSAGSLPGTAAF